MVCLIVPLHNSTFANYGIVMPKDNTNVYYHNLSEDEGTYYKLLVEREQDMGHESGARVANGKDRDVWCFIAAARKNRCGGDCGT